jgi:hypothetical protein
VSPATVSAKMSSPKMFVPRPRSLPRIACASKTPANTIPAIVLTHTLSAPRLLLLCSILLTCFGSSPAAAQSPPTGGKCGVFSEQLPSPAGAAAFALMASVGLELMAAEACVRQQNLTNACEHYRRALAVVDKMDRTRADERRPQIKARMAELHCS